MTVYVLMVGSTLIDIYGTRKAAEVDYEDCLRSGHLLPIIICKEVQE